MLEAADDFKVLDLKFPPMGDGPLQEQIRQAFAKWPEHHKGLDKP